MSFLYLASYCLEILGFIKSDFLEYFNEMEVPLSPGNLIIITGYVRNVSIMITSDLSIGYICSLDFLDPTYFLYLMVLLYPKEGKVATAVVLFSEVNLDACLK
jgi:hypothetical protein